MAGPRLAKQRATDRALLVRRVPYGESDLIVGLYTEQLGTVAVMARGARRTTRRFGALEPLHLLRVTFDSVPGKELGTLVEAQVERARIDLTESLEAMQAAGQALRWLRHAAPQRVGEPRLWLEINGLLDALGDGARSSMVQATLGAGGLRLLAATGWGLELGQCVRCDRPVPDGSRVTVDVGAGGVVCRQCGGGPLTLTPAQRDRFRAALEGDETALADPADSALARAVVDKAFGQHGRVG